MSDHLTLRRRARAERSHRSGWRRARTIVGTILLVVVSLFALVAVVIPLLMGAQTYTVLTGSMQPGMPPGTLIAVRQTPIEAVRVGDVVTYQIRSGDPAVVTHRVVGSTSSTGGDRLLITRGDANDADDPPVQQEQLRGTVVLAVPFLGYPGVWIGGQERGALVMVVGIAVVGYGAVLLILDLVRTRRDRRNVPAVVLAVVAAAVTLPFGLPDAAHAAPVDQLLSGHDRGRQGADGSVSLLNVERVRGSVENAGSSTGNLTADVAPPSSTSPSASGAVPLPVGGDHTSSSTSVASPHDASADYLRISLDGRQFVPGDGLPLIDSLGLLAPGATIATPLWIRNTGPDPAHAFLRLEVRVPDPNSGNLALADALALVVDGESVASGDEWRSAVIDPGGTARHDVGLRMDATAGNDTRRASVEVTPWVRLSDARGSAHEPETASSLPRTGGDVEPLIALGLLAAGVLGVGIALVVVGRRSRAR